MSELIDFIEKIELMREEIRIISIKLDKVMDKLEVNHEECTKMGNHINFVENVYQSIKSPLNFIFDKVNIYRDQGIGLIEETSDSNSNSNS
tara:strand:- start:160 stop:432 length:273 start_codon:yes stop_codon:yes gene_type:complete